MFTEDANAKGQLLSKGEIERQKRLKLREEERRRRMLGFDEDESVYDNKNKVPVSG